MRVPSWALPALLLVVLPLPALAQGQVTGITVSPASPVPPGTTVTVSVTATRPCGGIQIDYGDGQVIIHPVSTLPLTKQHTYSTEGTYTLVATGQANCSGQASTVLQVSARAGGIGALCKLIDCPSMLAAMLPRIERIFSFPFLIEPGGTVLVGGRNFGDERGDILLRLSSGVPPLPLVPIEGEKSLHWDDVSAAGRIPTISGVPDQKATLQIRTRSGLLSNEWPVMFSAAREIKVLPQDHVGVTCSDEADHDECNDEYTVQVYDFVSWSQGLQDFRIGCAPEYSVCAYHKTAVGRSEGTDVYRATLKNGWVFDSNWFHRDGGFAKYMAPFPAGGTALDFPVWWSNFDGDNWGSSTMQYWIKFFIVGPAGVPHR